jgi:hypothetical protein
MREDMFELIVERPRYGSRMGHRRRTRRIDPNVDLRRDPDAMPLQIGLKRWTQLGRFKSLNENLAPLRRYLEKQVNRPWNKVWSEICANLSTASTVHQHVRDHVGDFVTVNTSLKDGVIYGMTRWGKREPLADLNTRLYVDPRTGILRPNKHYRSWQRKHREDRAAAEKHRKTRMREIAPDVQLHKLDDGCWWEVRLAPIPKRRMKAFGNLPHYNVDGPFTDVVHRAKLSTLPITELYGQYGVYAIDKRQLSRREIDDLELPR